MDGKSSWCYFAPFARAYFLYWASLSSFFIELLDGAFYEGFYIGCPNGLLYRATVLGSLRGFFIGLPNMLHFGDFLQGFLIGLPHGASMWGFFTGFLYNRAYLSGLLHGTFLRGFFYRAS